MLRKLVIFGSLLALVCSTIFIINQTAQVVSLAGTVNPALARIVLAFLLAVYAVVILVPILLFIRLPKAMSPPLDEASREYQTYLRQLGGRLAGNPHLAGIATLDDRASVESAMKILDAKADEIMKEAASMIFVSTAVSQNGKLDALMVLAAQTRLIWQIAHIYNQRPNPRDFGRLYSNVGAAIFAANAIEEIDIGAQIAPVIHQAALHLSGLHLASLVPLVGQAADKMTDIVIDSVVEGTANAYLTLRVGIVCRNYCRSITSVDRREVRRNASIAAASMLGSVVSVSAASVVKAIVAGAMKSGQSVAGSAVTSLRRTGSKLNPFKAASDE
ncbi:MAG TPA: DUF697 domain-containing protein [Bryobacteraceae bacterium]|nr:DUF697 domain-containing protein [Bryobacteraceae bacterium]